MGFNSGFKGLMMIHGGFAKASSWCVTRIGIDVF